MASFRAAAFLIGAMAAGSLLVADPGENPQSVQIIDKYVAASEGQRARMAGLEMETEIEARISKLQKEGKLHALRHISRIGRITYNALRYTGDNIVKKEVIARFLTAENEAVNNAKSLAINRENYKFKYKGLAERDGRRVYVFDVRPNKKKVGLFKGELWIDASTYCAVREAGTLVKSPSVFLKKVQFVRSYQIQDGAVLLSRVDTVIDTRIIGRAELSVTYSDYRRVDEEKVIVGGASENQ